MFVDRETAYWTFSVIAGVSASLTGLLIIAAIFYLERLIPMTLRARRVINKYRFLYGRLMRFSPFGALALFLILFALVLHLGFDMTNMALGAIQLAPGLDTNQTLYPSLPIDISKTMDLAVATFHQFLLAVAVITTFWIAQGLFIAAYSLPRLDRFEKSMSKFEKGVLGVVRKEYGNYCSTNGLECRALSDSEAMSLLTTEELPDLRTHLLSALGKEWCKVYPGGRRLESNEDVKRMLQVIFRDSSAD